MTKGRDVLFCLQRGLMGAEGRLNAIAGQKDMKIRMKKTEYRDGWREPELFKIILSVGELPGTNDKDLQMLKTAFFVSAPIEFKIKAEDKDLYGTQRGYVLYFDQLAPVNGDVENKFLIRGILQREGLPNA